MPYRAFHQYKPLLDTCYIACGAIVAQASVVMGTMSDSRIWLGVNVPQWLGWLLFFLALGFGAAMSVHQESAVDKYIKRPALKPFYSLFLSRLCGGEGDVDKAQMALHFLSHLCGGEWFYLPEDTVYNFLSRLCGGESAKILQGHNVFFLSRLCGGEVSVKRSKIYYKFLSRFLHDAAVL